ncbi:MAG TPA: C1 family peptidase [Gemmataceae bacterium]|nr:C1 family peptidase [Gemmataceae bacterium]
MSTPIATLGWRRDLPDWRDYTPTSREIQGMLRAFKRPRRGQAAPPACVDWREFCPPIRDQEHLHACSSHAALALLQYFERRANGRLLQPSALFLYQMARRLIHETGDSGADLRTTLKALLRFGAPPEVHHPYAVDLLQEEPAAFLFSYTQEVAGIRYVRLDQRGGTGAETLESVRSFLAAGFLAAFGFPVANSVAQDADIPLPTVFDSIRGGQALVAVGYDDHRVIRSTRGALLIRNSWGPNWGEAGYGWLPYAFIEQQLAVDFWTLIKSEWLDSGEFGLPR